MARMKRFSNGSLERAEMKIGIIMENSPITVPLLGSTQETCQLVPAGKFIRINGYQWGGPPLSTDGPGIGIDQIEPDAISF
jgi:hypothetical protein